jgi:hypothetical protein
MTENDPTPLLPSPEEDAAKKAAMRKQRWIIIGIITGVIIVLGLLVWAIIALYQHPDSAASLRDIFIILIAFESLIVGAALVVLIVQVAGLINLLQNEVRPILISTKETISTLRGTTEFLSENLVEPVIKMNSYLAGLKKMLDMFNLFRK